MPPTGNIPVSTAALRTISQTSLMSTASSRLAEYSIEKCGMAGFLPFVLKASAEVATHRAVGAIVGLDGVALAGLDRADERSAQHDVARLQRQSVDCDLIGKPGDAVGRMIEHACG